MKFRNGFVSNSSSSSYLIAYDKSRVLTDPQAIVDFIDNHPRQAVAFMSNMLDGDDVFWLDDHQKRYLLKHRKRFVKWNEGTQKVKDYSQWEDDDTGMPDWDKIPEKDSPYVTAITLLYEFYHYPYEYERPEIDMSDWPEDTCTFADSMAVIQGTADEETKKRVDLSTKRENERYKREKITRKKKKEEFLTKVRDKLISKIDNPDNLVVKLIEVDNRSCDPDGSYESEFAERYFGLDEETYWEEDGDPDLDEPVDDGPFTREVED